MQRIVSNTLIQSHFEYACPTWLFSQEIAECEKQMYLVFSKIITQISQRRMENENNKRVPYGTKMNQCLAASALNYWRTWIRQKNLHPNL